VELIKAFLVVLILSLSGSINASDGVEEFGNVKVFYNIVPTSTLTPAMAKLYKIQRAENMSYINISVRTKDSTLLGEPVAATIDSTAVNEFGQTRFLEFREIKEPGAIYYIAILKHGDEETFQINADIIVHNDYKLHKLSFKRQLFHHQ
jgi:hypothetical protein